MSHPLPFLTDLDSRAQVKGSRDPLGLVGVWAHFGRRVVGNLSTVTTNLRDFTVRILGQWMVEQIAERRPDSQDLPAFLRFEQLCNYSRYRLDENAAFRGVERVRANLAEGTRVTLSASAEHQLLSNQRAYGVWGIYTVPSVSSALLHVGPKLADEGRALVETACLPFLRQQGIDIDKDLVRLIAEPETTIDLDGRHRSLVAALGLLLVPAVRSQEAQFYERHLLHGGPTDRTQGRQRMLAQILANVPAKDAKLSPSLLSAWSKEAAKLDPRLAADLDAIRVCESVLAPAARIFGWLGQQQNQTRERLMTMLRDSIGARLDVDVDAFRGLQPLFPADATDVRCWMGIAEALAAGSYGRVVDLLLELNALVLKQRGSAPWLEFRASKLSVRIRDESGDLPVTDELPELWQHSYFVDSLAAMVQQVGSQS